MRISDQQLDRIYVDRYQRESSFHMSDYHYHPYYEIYYVDHGQVDVFLQNTNVQLTTGDLMLIPPKFLHHMRYDGPTPTIRTSLYFRREDVEVTTAEALDFDVLSAKPQIYQVPLHLHDTITRKFADLLAERNLVDSYSVSLLLLRTNDLLLFLARSCTKLNDVSEFLHTTNHEIMEASQFMTEHFSEKISLAEIAEHVGFSPNYLSSKFKEVTGLGVHDYLNFIRLEQASSMLLQTNRKITDIALSCGFGSSNYFKDVFKKTYGVSPREYRKGQIDA